MNILQANKAEKISFFVLLSITLLVLIIPQYYVTGDGPSHMYNAKVFINMLFHPTNNFFKTFYQINRHLDPNYTSQLLLAFYNKIFPYWLADKTFQITYVCIFAFGFRYLMHIINPSGTALAFLFYPFCFTFPFQTGFYNYSLAIGILFFVVGYFIKHQHKFTSIVQLFFTAGLLLLSLTHGMVATQCILLCGLLILTNAIDFIKQKKSVLQILENATPAIICMLPACIIILAFTLRIGLATTPHPYSAATKFMNFCRLYCCQSTIVQENLPSISFGIGLVALALFIFIKGSCANFKIRNIMLVFVVFTFWSYMTAPSTIGGVGGTDIRFAFLPPLFLVLALSTYSIHHLLQKIIIGFAFSITLFFIGIRYANVMSASAETQNILSIQKNIASNKVLLAIQYNTYGSQNQMQLDNSFLHIFDYIGAIKNKSIIVLNNYEADLHYFSIYWKPGMNPHNYMPWIIEGKPPLPEHILDYEKGTKQNIDYIIWQDDVRKTKIAPLIDTNKIQLKQFLDSAYTCIDFVPKYGVLLYRRK